MKSNYPIVRALLSLALVFVLIASESLAQVPGNDPSAQWRRVQSVASGTEVEIKVEIQKLKNKIRGSFVSATDSTLVVSAKAGQLNIARSDIHEVNVKSESARLRKGAIGAAIGVAGGVGIAAGLDGALTDGNGISGGAALLLGAVGGLAGFLLRVRSTAYTRIYRDH